jgi:hypothetical protein
MSSYRRPSFPVEVYRDEQGVPIDYGHRWDGASPPEDAYSRVRNLQRFTPVHAVAGALVEWLQNTFDVTTEEGPAVATDLLHLRDDFTRAIRVVPREPNMASLTFVITQFPGVYLHAGLLHDFHFPACGCDACDDDATSVAEELEWTVFAVVSGGYSERLDSWPSHWIEYSLDEPGVQSHSGRSRINDLPGERVKVARAALPRAGHWLSWQKNTQDDGDVTN